MAEFPEKTVDTLVSMKQRNIAPRKSVVQVMFPGRGSSLAYYNDLFDLHVGDIVYVDGKLEGLRGRIVEVAYNFKIKISDYKRVTGWQTQRHTVSFSMPDRTSLPSNVRHCHKAR